MSKIINTIIRFTLFTCLFIFSNCNHKEKQVSILLYNGIGTSPNDVAAVSKILSDNHFDFVTINSDELNGSDPAALSRYKLLIIPGGNFIEMRKSITRNTAANIQKAVHGGLNYLGICAGGFMAGNTGYNSFNIAGSKPFKFYTVINSGIRKMAVTVTNADGSVIQLYWEDGPQFTGWGNVISKYPDGTAATVQGRSGRGNVILTGIHAEAPESWRKEFNFSTPIEKSRKYAVALITAALKGNAMAYFK